MTARRIDKHATDLAVDESVPFLEGLRYTDTDNSERFLHLHRGGVRYVTAWKSWIVWDGTLWKRDPGEVLVTELAKAVSRRLFLDLGRGQGFDDGMPTKAANWATQSASAGRITAMVKLARGMPGVVVDHEDLDADPWALGVANGWVDLRTGGFRDPDPEKLMTMASTVAYDAAARAPRWNQALVEWLPDPEVRSYFQRLCGEAMVGSVRDHLLVIVYGEGGNGKGTAIGTIAKVFGPYFVVPHKSLLVQQRHDAHPTEKAALFRARLAVAAETDSRSKLSEEQVKELTGGDRLSARRMYENPWQYDPTHSLWVQTNHLPEISGEDEGIWRRIRVMEWPATFLGGDADPELPDKLAEELPGVLNWMIEGALSWQRDGLQDPTAVTAASAAYRRDEDVLERFLDAKGYRTGPDLFVPSKKIMEDWVQWTEAEYGRRRAGKELARRLRGVDCTKDGRRPPHWHGIGKIA
jgi:putative DNA primase/helicase